MAFLKKLLIKNVFLNSVCTVGLSGVLSRIYVDFFLALVFQNDTTEQNAVKKITFTVNVARYHSQENDCIHVASIDSWLFCTTHRDEGVGGLGEVTCSFAARDFFLIQNFINN